MAKFKLVSKYQPTGDQPAAIKQLVDGINRGVHEQTLLGVTGSGKTFTMANIIEQTQRPTLILAHNKTLAAQLYSEFREFFPENEVHYFVSYFDYYQPEAYIASTDTYIEKDSAINDEIDRLRHGATEALLTRRDVIVVSSVSCIYGIGSPVHYEEMSLPMWRTESGWATGASEIPSEGGSEPGKARISAPPPWRRAAATRPENGTFRNAPHRIVALGTTVARTLEYYARTGKREGEDDIFIYPGFEFQLVDALITNYHAPKSTVLMLAAAFAGWDHLKAAYEHAIDEKYNFLSYGDSMLIC